MEPSEGGVVAGRLCVGHPDVVIVHVKVGRVRGRGDLGYLVILPLLPSHLGYVWRRGLSDVIPVDATEVRVRLEVHDAVLAHPDVGGADESLHEVLGAVAGVHVRGEVEAVLGRQCGEGTITVAMSPSIQWSTPVPLPLPGPTHPNISLSDREEHLLKRNMDPWFYSTSSARL